MLIKDENVLLAVGMISYLWEFLLVAFYILNIQASQFQIL